MASLQKTYSGDLSTSIAKQLWIARNIAAAAKGEADQIIGPNVDNDMLRPGEFMSRALQMRATSMLPKRFQRQMPDLMGSDYLLRGQSRSFASPINPQFTNNQAGARAAGQPFPWLAVGSPLKYQQSQSSATVSNTPKVPKAPGVNNTAKREKGVAVKDQQLGNFLAAVALSLSSSLNTINKKLDDTSEGVIAAKDGIDATHKKLEQHSDSLESKLDDIIDALRFANDREKDLKDQREFEAKKSEDAKATDLSTANSIIMNDMDRQQIRDMQAQDLAEDDRGPIGDPWDEPNEEQLSFPSLAEGGIVSGPDSGYLAVLHGDEMVTPLDNNYTQGQPSAVGKEPISQMPMMAERGLLGDNPSTMKPTFTRNTAPTTPLIKSSFSMDVGQNLADAIQLPSKAAGIVTMGIMGKVMNQVSLPPDVIANMKSLTAPIAAAFGVPDAISSGVEKRNEADYMAVQSRRDTLAAGQGRQLREKGVLEKIKDFIFGTGGGDITYRGGSGGSNTIYNRTSGGTGGGTSIAWGKKKQKEITSKSDFGSIRRRTATTDAYMVEAGMLDPSTFESKYGISADKWLRLPDYSTDQSSLNSPVFTKNVSYDNAYDYLNSPEYGLRTSEVAYNMSMDDEVNAIAEGMSDPSKSEIIAHNQTALNTNEKQMEISPITNRGNPLKDGIYLGAYSV